MATFYAHAGSSNDNAFNDSRVFMHFSSKKQMLSKQDEIWETSDKTKNLIPCRASLVNRELGKEKYLAPNGFVYSCFEDYIEDQELEDTLY